MEYPNINLRTYSNGSKWYCQSLDSGNLIFRGNKRSLDKFLSQQFRVFCSTNK